MIYLFKCNIDFIAWREPPIQINGDVIMTWKYLRKKKLKRFFTLLLLFVFLFICHSQVLFSYSSNKLHISLSNNHHIKMTSYMVVHYGFALDFGKWWKKFWYLYNQILYDLS